MKEKIIIDGVCINNCKYGEIIPYDYPTSGIDIECYIDYQNEITKDCKENHNCLYKQLKRLEQENEELKQKYEKLYEHQGEVVKAYSLNKNKLSLYKHALEEIRGINKYFFDMNYGFDEQGISEDVKEVAREIEEIITEAIGE